MEEGQIVVDVQASRQSEAPAVVDLKASLQCELYTLWSEVDNFTIFRTPHNISNKKENLFEPSVISIGPFHCGRKHLRAMEEQKKRFLRDFLSRGGHISLDFCIAEMKLLEDRTRRCYNEKFDDLKSEAFVKMMLLDGCFVLEYLYKSFEGNMDFIYDFGWNHNFIDLDVLLLENQIPFFIVEKLYEIGNFDQELRMEFVKCTAYGFLSRILTNDHLDSIDPFSDPPAEIHHLVHLCYHYTVPHPEKPDVLKGLFHQFCSRVLRGIRSPHSTSRSSSVASSNSTGISARFLRWYPRLKMSSMVIPSATELQQKGLKFKPKSEPKHMLDISFENGVLKIPRLKTTNDTKSIFANLLAFEQSKYGKKNKSFTRFVAFLDNLVNTPNDVTILQECRIVENWLGSEEELANFLNQVTEGAIYISDHYLVELYLEVNKYSESSWNRQRAKLIRDYLGSPWTVISLVAALILLILTCVQSFYAVYQYYVPSNS